MRSSTLTKTLMSCLFATSLSLGDGIAAQRPSWPLQQSPGTTGDPGQNPATYPKSSVAPSAPVRKAGWQGAPFSKISEKTWSLRGGWKLRETNAVPGTSLELSSPGCPVDGWHEATVPGTVLTTLVDRGVYPEPTYGLNNLAIPESLARQDYWYRNEFTLPEGAAGGRLSLRFGGVNYAAEVWLNGSKLGVIRGAFMRGEFDITGLVKADAPNALAVRISPPPHPGIPHEESLSAGAGPNGGWLCADGPTFFCTEGWDWIPGIRDRCSGLWQAVELHASGNALIGDLHIKTDLPLPDTSQAEVFLSVPVENRGEQAAAFLVRGSFEGASFEQTLTVPAKSTALAKFGSGEHPSLRVKNPRLWWPNGYGRPELYHLRVEVLDKAGKVSDLKTQRFGIRHVTYELSAFNTKGAEGRYEINPSAVWTQPLIDKRHAAILKGDKGWIPSLAAGAEGSPGLMPSQTLDAAPNLVIKVNGQRILCKGGNWGLDEALKRATRETLEPYLRLEREANMTMVRNWCGQSTSEAFYELCDEMGLMVWNDFWLSTQDWNQHPLDLDLWLANCEDVVRRYRNHPSIVLWCGRNEGVPPPALNEGIERIVLSHDCTRYYQPTSNQVSLLPSGPWVHANPVKFFSEYGKGFSTELGLPCVPTADAIRAMMPVADQWPISDTWAYHDWHQADHGEVQGFMDALERQYGAGTSLEDFTRKAQMINYDGHRALFEGMNAHLWKPTSGRLIWMSHPAWPSMEWQLYSSDYEPNGAYWGARKACEPVHIQLNLDTRKIAVANTTLVSFKDLQATAELFSLDGKRLGHQETKLSIPANATTVAFDLDETPVASEKAYLVRLQLRSPDKQLVSDNTYWQASKEENLKALLAMQKVSLTGKASLINQGDKQQLSVEVRNSGHSPVLLVRATVRDASGARVLPSFASDGGFSLLGGEQRTLLIDLPVAASPQQVTLEAWNGEGTLPIAKL